MNTESILRQTMQRIAAASANFQMGEISRLNKLAERVTEIQAIQQRLEQELASLVAELNQPSPGPGGPPTTQANPESNRHFARVSTGSPLLLGPVAISIDWSTIGKSHPKQTICERKASDTLRAFFETIHDRFGPETLARLVAIRANRAPLLSRQPQIEFLNPKQGVCYQHQQIGTTGWHVLTHSSTPEKLGIIRQVARALRFPPGAVIAQEVDLKQQMETLLN
jgi:hypothetical protein